MINELAIDINDSPAARIFSWVRSSVLLSAVGFGTMPIFGKLAYDQDVSVGDLLIVRFSIAAVIMTAIAWWRGGFRGLSRTSAIAAFLMGAIGYAAQSASFFAALTRIDASLLTLDPLHLPDHGDDRRRRARSRATLDAAGGGTGDRPARHRAGDARARSAPGSTGSARCSG